MGTCSQGLNFEAALRGAAQLLLLQEALGSTLQPSGGQPHSAVAFTL